jgi:hypothetical protein
VSDLTQFRDHCRKMAAAEHKPECKWTSRAGVEAFNRQQTSFEHMFGEDPASRSRAVHCEGCVTDADRALFAQMAGEVDDYLAPQVDLFGEGATEPTLETA